MKIKLSELFQGEELKRVKYIIKTFNAQEVKLINKDESWTSTKDNQ